ncbi:hypothetical protein FVEG_17454 [Fusarium verticillioides 7600]|uniref:Uncharacterized protein n=1 Tax=Gibberella moniliformis (strain M3125 / FGSC 7600) TaxID=334819 RepID=W7N4T4_GIBM7|nr:hypothetical protein FVEG_17454 [Fusarium verticillioides 7600]EWG55080.1 hypothetical protein FVEG_17454 [Fusarium verticillioides 7600]
MVEQLVARREHGRTIQLSSITTQRSSALYFKKSVESSVVHLIIDILAAISVEDITNDSALRI